MTNHIQIFVPSTTDIDKIASVDTVCKVQEAVKRSFSTNFGGYTAYRADGGYVADSGELICEPILVVTSVTDIEPIVLWAYIKRIGKALCIIMSQECVLVSVNGQVEFVS